MKNNILKLSAVSFIASALLIGCGTDSSTDDTNSNTGYFIDAAVKNAHYKTSSGLEGDTNEQGIFKYNTGDSVKFSIGKLVLGESKPNTRGLMTPKTLVAINDEEVLTEDEKEKLTLLLRTLQSLDSDGNTSNGISISDRIIDSLNNLENEYHIKDLNESSLLNLHKDLDTLLDHDFDGMIDTNITQAEDHFKNSIIEFNESYENKELVTKNKNKNGNNSHKKNKEHNKNTEESEHKDFNLSSYPTTLNLATNIKEALAYMGNEERLAYDVYNYLYEYQLNTNFIEIKQFTNIANKSEIKHINIVKDLVKRYDINDTELSVVDIKDTNLTKDSDISLVSGIYDIRKIQDLYDDLIVLGKGNTKDALKVGCMIEVVDVNDLDTYIGYAQDSNATDVVEAFNILRDGSYKHYWAFDKAMKKYNETGCYFEGDSLLTNKVGIYPEN